MNNYRKDRRLAGRYTVKTPLRVRLWKSSAPEMAAESVNVSQRGIYFATNSMLCKGETIEVLFNMPGEIIGEPTSEWRCTGHVVRVESIEATGGNVGVGVQFDCYEVSGSKAVDSEPGLGAPVRITYGMTGNSYSGPPWQNDELLLRTKPQI